VDKLKMLALDPARFPSRVREEDNQKKRAEFFSFFPDTTKKMILRSRNDKNREMRRCSLFFR